MTQDEKKEAPKADEPAPDADAIRKATAPSNPSAAEAPEGGVPDEERHGDSIEQAHGKGEVREGNRVETAPPKAKARPQEGAGAQP